MTRIYGYLHIEYWILVKQFELSSILFKKKKKLKEERSSTWLNLIKRELKYIKLDCLNRNFKGGKLTLTRNKMNPPHGNPSYNPPLVYTRNQHSKPTYNNTYVLYVNVFHTRIVLRIAYEILPPPSVTHFSLLSFRIHRDGISPVVGKTVSYYGYFVVNHSKREKKKRKKSVLAFDESFIRRLTPLSKVSIFQSKRLNALLLQ